MSMPMITKPSAYTLARLLLLSVVLITSACGSSPAAPSSVENTPAAPAPTAAAVVPAAIAAPAAAQGAAADQRKLCGLGTGQAATGAPIMVGAVVGETGPDDFSSAADTAAAYFDCVNANGGINGRPIEYMIEDDQWNPEVAAQVASKLVKDQGVVALVANASFVEMTVNAKLYEEENVLAVAAACAVRECFEARNIASTNAGPFGSNLGMVQWAVKNLGTTKVACIGLNIPSNGGWSCDGVNEWLQSQGLEGKSVLFDPAAADLTSVVLEASAGEPDTMLINLPGNVGVGILKAAEEQGLRDRYKWVAATPLYDLDVPGALGDYWNGALYVNIELTPLDANGPDALRWREVMDGYAKANDPRDSFSQAGFVAANIFVDTLLAMDPSTITRETVTEALRGVKNYRTDLLCRPWYFGPGDRHFPNRGGQTVQLDAAAFKVVSECYDVESSYLDPIRTLEQQEGLVGN